MKAALKRLLRAAWRRLAPFRRPVVRKYDNHMRDLLAPMLESSLRRTVEATLASAIEERLGTPLRAASWAAAHSVGQLDALKRSAHETDLVLNSLVREMVRLQMQVEYLQQLVAFPPPEPSVAREPVEHEDCAALVG